MGGILHLVEHGLHGSLYLVRDQRRLALYLSVSANSDRFSELNLDASLGTN